MNARETILARIRAGLEGVAVPPAPRGPAPGAPLPPAGTPPGHELTLADAFAARLGAVGGHVHRVSDLVEAAGVLARLARELGARELAHSDDPVVLALARDAALRHAADGGGELGVFDGSRDRARLLDATLGLTGAQLGVAETGSLVLCSESERHRTTSLVPEVHVALLHARDLVPTLGDALRHVHALPGARGEAPGVPPLVTLVTGPSRTADIELTLVVGVHGPRALHVLLLEP